MITEELYHFQSNIFQLMNKKTLTANDSKPNGAFMLSAHVNKLSFLVWKALPCGSLTSISKRSTKGRGIMSKEGSRSLFLFKSSKRKERTAASRGGGATPLNWRKLSLQRRTENCIHCYTRVKLFLRVWTSSIRLCKKLHRIYLLLFF